MGFYVSVLKLMARVLVDLICPLQPKEPGVTSSELYVKGFLVSRHTRLQLPALGGIGKTLANRYFLALLYCFIRTTDPQLWVCVAIGLVFFSSD